MRHKTLSIGTIRLYKRTGKTVIQLRCEDKWKSICTVSGTTMTAEHRKVAAQIFDLAVQHDWDADAMERQRTLLLQDLA